MATVIVDIPYGLDDEDLVLEPGVGADTTQRMLEWLAKSPSEEMVERVLRATTCLFTAKAGPYAACLETAIIWEVG